ncbi:helicase-related protein [Lactobacillus sp. ESL0679]|uniref:DEAD/DEAH box helicase family protein n=1 Tax=Lactobacillus sp. ESL0679 TaxID=2983209 RepID=UPI0023F7AB3E|nr:DEAD/DEAH box helicase family protein [Lactobacillus sp. ESL0679]MDF7683706.1 helicase-related protein [Lactobacillus sp. ESL0679]
MEDLMSLAGRQWIGGQEDFSTNKALTKIAAIVDDQCNRCGAKVSTQLPNGKKYCRACINIGRIVEGDYLVRNQMVVNFPPLKTDGLTWQGELTAAQAQISQQLVDNFNQHHNVLVHAVTGAGKTEMLFALLAECFKLGQRACIATPRIDVVNELYPRLQAAFGQITIGMYHGRKYQEPQLDQLTICTTHQLLKFYQAFDLLVIDEVDSFPYANNAQLHFGAQNAVKGNGVRVYLTATPTADLLAQVKAGQLQILKLKRRFHGGKLPVPKEKLFLRSFLNRGKIHPKLMAAILKVIAADHPLLLFVPRIEQIPLYLAALKQEAELADVAMAGVHAGDKKRLEKVQQFRQQLLQILITTTILERGVTFNHVWVIVIAADDRIYQAASLVQIAGRVGRAKEDNNGLVLFCYHKYTASLRSAMRQIRAMNR